ncbi:glycosyltransferase family 2 protein, partial [Mycobacterium attenuatum]|uniref:glycosyltransferase family 2 protein n=1 Tax=Mycobacterium attenuatum TaxID=2341086 RepID=UPI000F01F91D
MTSGYAIVVPTVGRESLQRLGIALSQRDGPAPAEVVVVDDRPHPCAALEVGGGLAVRVLASGGRGPAAARNVGWRATAARWVCFLDDDVVPGPRWRSELAADLAVADAAGAVGSQAVIEVPAARPGRPTDDDRRTLRLASARWITADMAYRRDALVGVGGFDERFRRAYREDSDLAARIVAAGGAIARGSRRSLHPVAPASWWSSVRAQAGNRDDALLRRKYGRSWRTTVGEGPGRLPAHLATTAAGGVAVLAALLRRDSARRLAAMLWLLLTAEFSARRWRAGPRSVVEALRISVTSALIPPVAVAHRLTGGISALRRLREHGLLLAVVTNQSGVARGLIST